MRLMLDTSQVSFTVSRGAEPKTERETGQQRTDKRTGQLLWLVQVIALDADGGEVIKVTVAGEQPKLTVGQPAEVQGLEAIPWVQGDRNGVAYRAASITQQPASKSAQSAA